MVNETSTIACNGPDGELHLDGDLIISSGKTLLIAASENHIAGAIKTEGLSGYVHIGSQGSWQVQGSPDALLSLGIENQSGLSVHGTGLFQLSHAQLELAPFSTLQVNSKSAFHQVNLQSINETSVCSFFNRLQWDQGTLHNASISHQHPECSSHETERTASLQYALECNDFRAAYGTLLLESKHLFSERGPHALLDSQTLPLRKASPSCPNFKLLLDNIHCVSNQRSL